MPLKIGNNNLGTIRLGGTNIGKVMLGDTLLFGSDPRPVITFTNITFNRGGIVNSTTNFGTVTLNFSTNPTASFTIADVSVSGAGAYISSGNLSGSGTSRSFQIYYTSTGTITITLSSAIIRFTPSSRAVSVNYIIDLSFTEALNAYTIDTNYIIVVLPLRGGTIPSNIGDYLQINGCNAYIPPGEGPWIQPELIHFNLRYLNSGKVTFTFTDPPGYTITPNSQSIDVESTYISGEGDGTPENPYLIGDSALLRGEINFNNGKNMASEMWEENKHFKLIDNIDGNFSQLALMSNSTFDGCWHTVNDLYNPLFQYCAGSVKNVYIKNYQCFYDATDSDGTSPINLYSYYHGDYQLFENIFVTGYIQQYGNTYIGGLLGSTSLGVEGGSVYIFNCASTVHLVNPIDTPVGGLIGYVRASTIGISNSWYGGQIYSQNNQDSGGIIGWVYSDVYYQGAYFDKEANYAFQSYGASMPLAIHYNYPTGDESLTQLPNYFITSPNMPLLLNDTLDYYSMGGNEIRWTFINGINNSFPFQNGFTPNIDF